MSTNGQPSIQVTIYTALKLFFNYFDLSVPGESYVDETRVGVLNYNPGTFDN